MSTVGALWSDACRRLQAAGVETPILDTRLLFEAGTGLSRVDLIADPGRMLTDAQVAAIEVLICRRETREPVGHIIGHWHFWTVDLSVGPEVLIPRPETELIVETALEAIAPEAPARVLDFGAGSGAIMLSILCERRRTTGLGIDISAGALATAKANARALGVCDRADFLHGDWSVGLSGPFDIVVSNPPYIATGEIGALEPEVACFEPRVALDGGDDGLYAYRALIPRLPALLAPKGVFALEVGKGQAEAVAALARSIGLSIEPSRQDLMGVPRIVWGRRAA